MSLKALSDYTFYSRYSQYLPEEKRRETWPEAVTRVFDMHRDKYSTKIANNEELKKLIDWAESMQKKKRVLAAQRTLQFAIEPILKHELKNYNCTATHINRERVFAEMMYVLLCGCGAGFSVQKQHIKELGNIKPVSLLAPTKEFVVDDSIEGWAEAIGAIMDSYFENPVMFPEYNGKDINFNFENVRPEGSLIAGRFKAPGPEGLANGLNKIKALINKRIKSDEFKTDEFAGKLRPIDAYDIIMHISDCVLSGGVRRSATLCMFSYDDVEMMNAKTGKWFEENPQRGRSNNSAVLLKGHVKEESFSKLMNSTKEYGEPGFIWVDNLDIVFNPCVTGDTTILTSDGIKTVDELVDKKFTAIIDGKEYETVSEGFWKTGTKQVFKLETAEGYDIRLTDNHKLLCVDKNNVEVWKELKDIEIGDKLKINNHQNYSWGNGNESEFEKGWLTGNLVGDGTFHNKSAILRYWGDQQILQEKAINYLTNNFRTYQEFKGSTYNDIVSITSSKFRKYLDENFDINSDDKTPNVNLERASSKFLEGYVQGLFDADGSVQGNQQKGVSIRLTQNNLDILKQVQRILLRLGIVGKIYKGRRPEGWYALPDGNGGIRDYFCKEMHELIISKENVISYTDRINFLCEEKRIKLEEIVSNYKRNPNKEKFITTVSNIKEDGFEDVYDVTVENVHRFDANGIVAHNCVEVGMYPKTEDGRSGWQGCNLTEINGKYCSSEENFLKACEASAIIGTLQAGYTDFKFLKGESKEIFDREALLGCSITGWMDNPETLFDPKIQQKGATRIREVNEKVAKMIGINPASRATCVKPAGSTSSVLGTASGIHPHHARRYIRRTQVNRTEFCGQVFQKENPLAVEKSVWSANGTDNVISFLCEVPPGAITKNQMSAVDLLEKVKLTQANWVEYGTNIDRCTLKELRHNVSNTVQVLNDEEWEAVEKYIFDNQEYFAGISLLAASGDLDYPQAPFSTVLTPNELIKEYGDASVFASGLIVDGLAAFNDNLWEACSIILNEPNTFNEPREVPAYPRKGSAKELANFYTEKIEYDEWFAKVDWIRRAKQFAERYFDGDVKTMTHCLKHVSLWKTWCDLQREYVDIDWTNMEEEQQTYVNADTLASQACVGAKGCDV